MQDDNPTSENRNLPALQAEILKNSELPALAAGLVHEVRNPLAAIHLQLQLLAGYAGEIQEEELRDKIKGKIEMIQKQVLGLNDILQEFIHLIRPQRQEKEVRPNINGVVGEIVNFIEPQAKRAGIHISFDPQDLTETKSIDPVFVKQILYNLLLNSIQAFEESKIPENERQMNVSTGMEDRRPFIRVEDNGPGIAPEDQARIFDAFFTRKSSGSGLGLALVKKMAGEMGGHIDFNSKLGEGTRFTVYLGRPQSG